MVLNCFDAKVLRRCQEEDVEPMNGYQAKEIEKGASLPHTTLYLHFTRDLPELPEQSTRHPKRNHIDKHSKRWHRYQDQQESIMPKKCVENVHAT